MGRPPSASTDLYAVGVVLYECLTGHPPYAADSAIELLAAILDGRAARISTVVPDAPARLDGLVHQQLHFEATGRAHSAQELAHNLAEIEYTNRAAT